MPATFDYAFDFGWQLWRLWLATFEESINFGAETPSTLAGGLKNVHTGNMDWVYCRAAHGRFWTADALGVAWQTQIKIGGENVRLSRGKAIRAKCIDCCAGDKTEVRRCPCVDCPLHIYRMGRETASSVADKQEG